MDKIDTDGRLHGEMAWEVRLELKQLVGVGLEIGEFGEMAWEVRLSERKWSDPPCGGQAHPPALTAKK